MRSKIQNSSLAAAGLLLSFFTAFAASADDVWDGYTRLSWLETDGSNWIDTGVKARNGLVVSADLKLLSDDPNLALFGACDSDNTNGLGLVTRETMTSTWNQLRVIYNDFASTTISAFTLTYNSSNGPHRRYLYSFDNGYFKWASNHPSSLPSISSTTFESQGNIFISWMGGQGANGGSTDYAPAPLLIYAFDIKDKTSGAYLRRMLPARSDSDGRVGMLDISTGAFYGHSGSKPFIAGSEYSCTRTTAFQATGYFSELTVSGYAGGSTVVSNMPVLVKISTSKISGFDYSDTLAGGADVFFSTDLYGVERLACDIDTWDTSGTSLVWVKLPVVSGTNTKFYMFWGSGSAATRPPSTEVWSGYIAVWHMNSYDPVTGVRDETGHGFNLTNETGSTTVAYAGQFGQALKLVNASDSTKGGRLFAPNFDAYVTPEAVTNLMPDVITISAWYKKPDGKNAWDDIIGKYLYAEIEFDFPDKDTQKIRYGWLWQMPDSLAKMSFHCSNGTSSQSQTPSSMLSAQSTWIYAAERSDGYNHKYLCYYDNATSPKKSGTWNSTADRAKTFGKTSKPVWLGSVGKSTAVDEVRICRDTLSDARVLADYSMMNNATFVTASAAQAAYSAVVDVLGPAQEYGSSSIQYGTDLAVSAGVAKTYSAPATVELTGAAHRAVCDGWELRSIAADGSATIDRTSESPLDGENGLTCVVTPHERKTLTWLWHEEYLLTLSPADSTMGTVPASAWYNVGSTQAIVPTPAEGYMFYCWTGDTNDMDVFSTSIPMDRPRALVATFLPASQAACEFSCPTNTSAAIDFFDPQYWTAGRVPNALAAQVTLLMPPEGVTNTIKVLSPFHISSLDVGTGSGEGRIEIVFMTGLNVTSSVSGDVHLRPNTCITHELGGYDGAKKNVRYTVNLSVGGDMTIDAGASVDVTAKGHIKLNHPDGNGSSYITRVGGVPHAGVLPRGGKAVAYGSAKRPCMYGSGGTENDTKGGGVIRLSVAGTLTVNGAVKAESYDYASICSGAGGSVWIDAGILLGSGRISADAGDSVYGPSGSGGRVAVYLTDPSSTDFSGFSGLISAYGGRSYDTNVGSNDRQHGPAGTVYLQAYGQTVESSTLIVDNYKVSTRVNGKGRVSSKDTYNKTDDYGRFIPFTILSDDFDCGTIGNLVVRNGGHVDVSNRTVKVYGGISMSDARFKSDTYTGEIKLCGTGDAVMTGTSLYYTVSCEAPGKKLYFGTGPTNNFRMADGRSLTLKGGEEAPLSLLPLVPNEAWNMELAATTVFDGRYLAVSNSDASAGAAATGYESTNLGGNSNWAFPRSIAPGDPVVWNGTYSSLWSDVDNWTDKYGEGRLPMETDSVTIPSGCDYYPTIMSDTAVGSLSVAGGAALAISNGAALLVTNSFTMAGTFTATGGETIEFSGASLDFTGGTVNPGNSTFTISGDIAQTLDFAGCTFRRLYFRKSGGSASVTGSLTAELFDALATNAVTLAFSDGVAVAAQDIVCRSRVQPGEATAALALVSGSGRWYANAARYQYFSGVAVSNCTAGALTATADALSNDLGGNQNWTFSAHRAEWIGGTGNFDVAGNWYPAGIPGAGTDVVISGADGVSAVTASGNVTARSITVGGGTHASSLYVGGVLNTSSDLVVGTNATLTLTSPTTDNVVGGNFKMLNGARATHPALPSNIDSEAQADASGYRFRVSVAGDVVIEPKATINVNYKGYAVEKGPLGYGKKFLYDLNDDGIFETTNFLYGGGHAGVVCYSQDPYKNFLPYLEGVCYGSMFEPLSHGSGGRSNWTGPGGGVVKIACAGNFTFDGSIFSNAQDYTNYGFTGAGGSVWLSAGGSFSGSGTIIARGGTVGADYPGSGGRIAIYAASSSFTGFLSASQGKYSGHDRSYFTGTGTILVKTNEYYEVTLDNDLYDQTQNYTASYYNRSAYWLRFVTDARMAAVATDIPSRADEDKIALFKKVRFSVGHLSAINLRSNLKIDDIVVTVNTGSYVRLNGYTLRVLSSAHKNAKGWAGGSVERSTRERGEIIWGAGFAVTVR